MDNLTKKQRRKNTVSVSGKRKVILLYLRLQQKC